MIDLTSLYSKSIRELSLNGDYTIPCEYYKDSSVIKLSIVHVEGSIKELEDDYMIIANIKGEMTIEDSVSLDEVLYPFDIEIDEKLDEFIEKDKKTLDINEFLWQNIVLEVPLRYTSITDYDEYLGDGWKLVSEEDLSNNPFLSLLNNEDRSD